MHSRSWVLVLLSLAVYAIAAELEKCAALRPNIVMIFTDDQDLHLGSLDYMPTVQEKLVAQGTTFTNHWATISICCPSRASLFRGQAGHNTNITHVRSPGGNYDKWVKSQEDQDYLPMWLKIAGYHSEYVGKFLNGYSRANYKDAPKGWSHVDALVDPFTYNYNTVVMSENGKTPILYEDYHQTDVIRAKALARIEHLTNQTTPFYLTIAPTSPHVQPGQPPVPLKRHENDYPYANVSGQHYPFYNPNQTMQDMKVSWIKNLDKMNSTQIDQSDLHFKRRIQALQGIDEIVNDVVNLLDEKGVLDNTYIIYTTDNGYHLGNHRVPAGKALPYLSDTNLPFIVRGPGVPANKVSRLPGTHLDLAPTFLDITGLDADQWPVFLDGRSLLDNWHNPNAPSSASDMREIINIEFWGNNTIEDPYPTSRFNKNSYKTLRIVSEDSAWLFSRWCTQHNNTELYDTIADPYELRNLAINPSNETQRLIDRLNALLLVTKSCAEDTCRNPWSVLEADPDVSGAVFTNLSQAMDPRYDAFFAGLPDVKFAACLDYQDTANEAPYYPPGSKSLAGKYREDTNGYKTLHTNGTDVKGNTVDEGTWEQRNDTLEKIMQKARKLTADEIGVVQHGDAATIQGRDFGYVDWMGF